MHYLYKPCNDCPFRKNSVGGWLGDYEDAEALHSLVMNNELPFPCHQTQWEEEINWKDVGSKEAPLCAGALLYMKKNGKIPRVTAIRRVMDLIGDETDNILSVPEFFKHHERE